MAFPVYPTYTRTRQSDRHPVTNVPGVQLYCSYRVFGIECCTLCTALVGLRVAVVVDFLDSPFLSLFGAVSALREMFSALRCHYAHIISYHRVFSSRWIRALQDLYALSLLHCLTSFFFFLPYFPFARLRCFDPQALNIIFFPFPLFFPAIFSSTSLSALRFMSHNIPCTLTLHSLYTHFIYTLHWTLSSSWFRSYRRSLVVKHEKQHHSCSNWERYWQRLVRLKRRFRYTRKLCGSGGAGTLTTKPLDHYFSGVAYK